MSDEKKYDGRANLIPIGSGVRTKTEEKEIARKGGIASGEARRAKRALKEQLKLILSLDLTDTKLKTDLEAMGITDDLTNGMAMNFAIFQKALGGDTRAWELIRDTIGEKPIDKVEQTLKQDVIIDLSDFEQEPEEVTEGSDES